MDAHRAKHDPRRRFRCADCDWRFASREVLEVHRRQKHDNNLQPVDKQPQQQRTLFGFVALYLLDQKHSQGCHLDSAGRDGPEHIACSQNPSAADSLRSNNAGTKRDRPSTGRRIRRVHIARQAAPVLRGGKSVEQAGEAVARVPRRKNCNTVSGNVRPRKRDEKRPEKIQDIQVSSVKKEVPATEEEDVCKDADVAAGEDLIVPKEEVVEQEAEQEVEQEAELKVEQEFCSCNGCRLAAEQEGLAAEWYAAYAMVLYLNPCLLEMSSQDTVKREEDLLE